METTKLLIPKDDTYVVAKTSGEIVMPEDIVSFKAEPTSEVVGLENLAWAETKVHIDSFPCGNSIENAALLYGTKARHPYVIFGKKEDVGKADILAATYFSKKS